MDKDYPAPAPAPVSVEHAGAIGGRVTFAGPAPKLPALAAAGDAHCAKLHPDGIADESVVVGSGGGLANVFVYLKDAPASNGSNAGAVLLDQVGCRYVPHAVAIQVNQPLRVQSSDPVLHNVHIIGQNNPAMNFAEVQGARKTTTFAHAEMLRFRCDIHPWMRAVVGVFDNPYFAVTDATGSYAIHGVPPGQYTLTAWHERFGELTKKVTVGPDGNAAESFSYQP